MSKLLNAVFSNDLAKITKLLDRDPQLIADTEALCQGIGWGRREAVAVLIRRGADLNRKDRNGNHPLDMACISLESQIFHDLVSHGSRPDQAVDLVVNAARCGRIDILRYLLPSDAV